METADLNELHKVDLDMAEKFANICDRNGMTYYMLGGTMLGAVRHQGFIPWDDDMDFGLFRDDYDRFLEIAPDLLPNHLNIITYKDCPDFQYYMARMVDTDTRVIEERISGESRYTGAYIDIFPIDGTPDGWFFRQAYFFKVMYHRALMTMCYKDSIDRGKKRSFINRFLLAVLDKFPIDKFTTGHREMDMIDHLMRAQDSRDSRYVGNLMGAYKLKEVFPREVFGDGAMYLFEDSYFRGPAKADEYLSRQYGDYMNPLSEEEIGWKSHIKILSL